MEIRRNNIDGIKPPRRELPRKKSEAVASSYEEKPVATPRIKKVKKRRSETKHHTVHTSSARSRNWLAILRIAAPITLGIIASIIAINQLDSARVRIHPHRALATIDDSLTLSKTAGVNELDFAVIAITDSVEVPLEADTTVPVNKYASGMIRIFNEYSTAPQKLSPSTRFESVDGKIFMISDEEELIIPGMTEEGPGEVTTMVYASEPGEAYNIDATDFSIPGFNELGLDEKYSNIYALSTQAFTGGFVGTKPAVSESLQQTFEQQLKEELVEKLQQRLLTDKTHGMSVITNTTSVSLDEVSFHSQEGSEGVLSVQGSLYALLVSKERLGTYLAQQEFAITEDEKVLLDETSTVNLRYVGSNDIAYETVTNIPVTITGEALFVWQPDAESIASVLTGIEKQVIPTIADRIRSIGAITVKNHPRWRSTLPIEENNIEVSIISD